MRDELAGPGADAPPPEKGFCCLLDEHANTVGHDTGARCLCQTQKERHPLAIGQFVGQTTGHKDFRGHSRHLAMKAGRSSIDDDVEPLVSQIVETQRFDRPVSRKCSGQLGRFFVRTIGDDQPPGLFGQEEQQRAAPLPCYFYPDPATAASA